MQRQFMVTMQHVDIHVEPITHCGHTDVQCSLPIMQHGDMHADVLVEPVTHYACMDVQNPFLIMQHGDLHSQVMHHVDIHAQGTLPTLLYGDLYACNHAIKTYAKSGSSKIALHLFEQLQQQGMMPEKPTFTSVILACTSRGLADGKRMHTRIFYSVYGCDPVVNTALLNMYGKQGNLDHVSEIFDKLISRDVVAWSAIITANAQHGKGQRALQLYYQMLEEGLMPDKIALVCVLDACIYVSEKERLWMYVYIVNSRHADDVVVGTALVNMCGKCNNLYTAMEVFKKMIVRNVRTWSAMIAVHVQHVQGMKALQLFDDMQEQGVSPNEITLISVLTACILEDNLRAGQQLHACMAGSGLEMDLSLGNSLLNLYGKCGKFEDAARLFQALFKLDVITFTTIIAACVHHGKIEELFYYVSRMVSSGHMPDPVTFVSILEACVSCAFPICNHVHSFIIECGYDSDLVLANALLNAYCKHSNVLEVHWIFNNMVVRDAISWNAIISLHAQQEQMQEVLQLLQQMQQETMLDKVTLLHAMNAFNSHAALPYGIRLHTRVLANRLQSEVSVGTALVSMYGRCGSLKFAQRVFNEQQSRDLILWNAMVTVSAHFKQGNEVSQLFDRLLLECFIPDKVCFISFLSAFCGQVVTLEGKRMHSFLQNSPFVSDLAVNNALMNMYGKCGSLEDARNIFSRMPEWDSISWNTLLSLCNLHGHIQEVKLVSDKMIWEGHLPDKVTWTNHLTAYADAINLAEGKRVHSRLHYNNLDTDSIVLTALLNMYGKCGNLEFARSMFDQLPRQTLVSWNTMLAVYAQHGLGKETFELFNLLREKVLPDRATFVSVLAACSHAGLLVEGCRIFASMNDHGFPPSADDFSCMIHLLGRVGNLDGAENVINAQPYDTTSKSFLALLSACRLQRDVERGEHAARQVFHLDSENAAAYVLLSNLYADDAGHNAIVAMVAEG